MHQQETESIGHGQGKMVDGNNEDELEDINLFEDMQPAFRRAKKVSKSVYRRIYRLLY